MAFSGLQKPKGSLWIKRGLKRKQKRLHSVSSPLHLQHKEKRAALFHLQTFQARATACYGRTSILVTMEAKSIDFEDCKMLGWGLGDGSRITKIVTV